MVNFVISNKKKNISLHKNNYSPQTQGLNSVFLGVLNDEAWKFGTFGYALQHNLFQSVVNGTPYALDLLAYNINRGREQYNRSITYFFFNFKPI